MNSLIVLTNKYPFGTGESFIENERSYWSVFDRVYICPVIAEEDDVIRQGFVCNSNEIIISTFDSKPHLLDIIGNIIGVLSQDDFLQEVTYLRKTGRLSGTRIKNLLGTQIYSNMRVARINAALKKTTNTIVLDDVLIYAYWLYEPIIVGIGLKRLFNTPRLISRAHGYDIYEERHAKMYIPYRKLVFDSTDSIYPVSRNGRDYLCSMFNGDYSEKIHVERLGTKKWYDDYTGDRYDFPETVLVSCASLSPVKRINLIIEALKVSDKNISWYHFGGGPLKESIMTMIQDLPANIKVFLMDQVPNKVVQEFYSSHYIDAFINVSESEGVPVSIMEAQSYGIPVIATDVGGTSEIVIDGENGVLLNKTFKSEELLQAIELVQKEQSAYRLCAKETWQKNSNADRNYKKFFDREIQIIHDKINISSKKGYAFE